MKINNHHLYYLFYPGRLASPGIWRSFSVLLRKSGRIFFVLLLFKGVTTAQESPSEEFIFGSTFHRNYRFDLDLYEQFRASGMNFLEQYADPDPDAKDLLEGINFGAWNNIHPYEWIDYYSTAYYSKWEAEEDQEDINKAGVKHTDGEFAVWRGESCWSSVGITTATNKIVYGPHYHQEKLYKRWYDKTIYPNYDNYDLSYTPRFRMALALNDEVGEEEAVCNLYIVVRHSWVENNQGGPNVDDTLKGPITLYVSDFPSDSTFKDFYFSNNPEERWYEYPVEYRDIPNGNKMIPLENLNGYWRDNYGNQGIQFCVDWLRNDDKCTLYVDYIEVYDNDGGQHFANNPALVTSRVVYFAQQFLQQDWPNMKYWGGTDEPSSIDSYTPIKTVAAILQSAGATPLMNTIWAHWTLDLNGESQLERYYETVIPEKLLIDLYQIELIGKKYLKFDIFR